MFVVKTMETSRIYVYDLCKFCIFSLDFWIILRYLFIFVAAKETKTKQKSIYICWKKWESKLEKINIF